MKKLLALFLVLGFVLAAGAVEATWAFKGVASSNQTRFLGSDSETNIEPRAQFVVPTNGVIAAVGVNVAMNTLDGPMAIRLRLNGSDSAYLFSFAAGQTGQALISIPVPVTGGDLLSVEVDATGASVGQARTNVTVEQVSDVAALASVPAVSPLGLGMLALLLTLAGVAWIRLQ